MNSNHLINIAIAGITFPKLTADDIDPDNFLRLIRGAARFNSPVPALRVHAPKSREHRRRREARHRIGEAFRNIFNDHEMPVAFEGILEEVARLRRSSDLWHLADAHVIGPALLPISATVSRGDDGAIVFDISNRGPATVCVSLTDADTPERATWFGHAVVPREPHVTLRVGPGVYVELPIDGEHEDVLTLLLAGAPIRVDGFKAFQNVPGLAPNPVLREHVMAVLADE